MDDNAVALFAILAVFGFPMGALVFARWLSHRERMEMIHNGMAPPSGKVDWRAMRSQPPPGPGPYDYAQAAAQATLRKGITVAFVGLALTIGLSFIGYDDSTVRWHPGPWLLGGLVPLFVGLAQILSALLSGASFPTRRWQGYPPPGPAGPGDPAQPETQTFDGSYTYRPGSTQELRPPAPPPERRP
ncbi:MAG: DUF6249 domain-containing protein [Vulcanimicrobiaceae bacterium]